MHEQRRIRRRQVIPNVSYQLTPLAIQQTLPESGADFWAGRARSVTVDPNMARQLGRSPQHRQDAIQQMRSLSLTDAHVDLLATELNGLAIYLQRAEKVASSLDP